MAEPSSSPRSQGRFASVPKWVLAKALGDHQQVVCSFCSTGRQESCRDEDYVQILAEAIE